jgi:hypothetical protein
MKIFQLLLLIVALTACNNEKSKYAKAAEEIAAKVPDSKGMNVGREKYKLAVPNGWSTEHRTAYGVDYYYLLAPKTKDDPNTNISVITETMHQYSLEEYKAETIKSIQKAIPSATILQQGNIIANGMSGGWFSYSMQPHGVEAVIVCYIFPKNNVAYVINAGTQTKDASRYRRTFDEVAMSFQIEK